MKGSNQSRAQLPIPARGLDSLYALALLGSISLWFTAIRAPLWLDETHSFFVIKAGLSQIRSRVWPIPPFYPYLLWFSTKLIGTSEIALRIPSVLAMLGAVYLLYRAALELFDRDIAVVAAVVFCLHPVVVFAALDVRPYALAAVAINASILALFHLRQNDSNWLAALFGLAAASIAYFQFLFVILLPALAIAFFVIKSAPPKIVWRQAGVALATFVLASLPVLPVLQLMFQTRASHVFATRASWRDLVLTLTLNGLILVLVGVVLLARAKRKLDGHTPFLEWRMVVCALLAFVPILILFGVSRETSTHIFVARYRLVAIPGIALAWAWIASRITLPALRLMLCLALLAAAACLHFRDPSATTHGTTWKYALELAENNASPDNAPVLICSDFHEADDVPMPVGDAVKDSGLFAPLSYYPLSVPVVGLPRQLNDETIRIASGFLREAVQRRQRFLVVVFKPSYKTLDWIVTHASATHSVRELGVSNDIKVMEFTPRPQR
jgi:mannosyltransferase